MFLTCFLSALEKCSVNSSIAICVSYFPSRHASRNYYTLGKKPRFPLKARNSEKQIWEKNTEKSGIKISHGCIIQKKNDSVLVYLFSFFFYLLIVFKNMVVIILLFVQSFVLY